MNGDGTDFDTEGGTYDTSPEASAPLSAQVFDQVDTNLDGIADTFFVAGDDGSWAVLEDWDADGLLDRAVIDVNGDGIGDMEAYFDGETVELWFDGEGTGVMDTHLLTTWGELEGAYPALHEYLSAMVHPTLSEELVDGVEESTRPGKFDIPQDGFTAEDGQLSLIGDPFGKSEYWFYQAFNGSCVPASVAQILSAYTGTQYTDLDLINTVSELGGWVVDDEGIPGMTPEGTRDLMVAVGIPATLEFSSMDELGQLIESDHGVIVFIDSGEIWYGESVEDGIMDHAVTVTGIDYQEGLVYISDTGSETGDMSALPIELFEDAWADSSFQAVVCDEPAGIMTSAGDSAAADDDSARAAVDGVVQVASPLESFINATVQRPWVLLPVAIPAAAVLSAAALASRRK